MEPLVTSSIIGAGASVATGAGSAVVGNRLNKKNREFYERMTNQQNQFNAEQAQIAYNRQRELYDYQFAKESQYNSPLAQMSRMREAGLNPALLAGNGQIDAGSVSAAPSGVGAASAASPNPPQLQNYFTPAIESVMQVKRLLLNIFRIRP